MIGERSAWWGYHLCLGLTLLLTLGAASDCGESRRRTWTIWIPIASANVAELRRCLRATLESGYGETRVTRDRESDDAAPRYFRSPIAYGGGEQWNTATVIERDNRVVLEFSDDWSGTELTLRESKQLAEVLGAIVRSTQKRCPEAGSFGLPTCETYPEGEPCPLPQVAGLPSR